MSTLIAHITVVEGGEAAFEALAKEMYEISHRVETGLRRYEYWRKAEPRQYYAIVACDDFQSFITHQTSDHHETFGPRLGKVMESIRLEFVDPVQGGSDLPPTDMQDATADADELTVSYTKRFAANIADWWLPLR